MKLVNLLLVLTILSMSPLLAQAEVYKWKDKDGSIRYTDTPPPSNIKQEAIGSKKGSKATGKEPLAPVTSGQPAPSKESAKEGSKDASKAPTSKESEATKIKQSNAEAEKRNKQEKEAEAKRKESNCKAAKANFETYKQGGRVYKMNEKGEREYMDDKDLQAGLTQSQKEIDENCN